MAQRQLQRRWPKDFTTWRPRYPIDTEIRAPDDPQFFPSCQAYRILPVEADFAFDIANKPVQVRYYQWDDPKVRKAILHFAVQAMQWALTQA
ncbi:MAG: hypothetical protein EXR77_18405 [Myxococcales bacterium]|nr:hypothetical protein [Myxococcales bacterium]